MTDAVLSGYKEEAQTVAFSGTQTMASLADNEWTDLSDEIDNSTLRYMLADFQLDLGSITAGTTGDEAVELYIIPCIDGTNYPDWLGNSISDAQENNQYYVGSFTIKQSGAATKRSNLRAVSMPNGKFKIGVRNRCNVALAASGNTIKYRRHQFASG